MNRERGSNTTRNIVDIVVNRRRLQDVRGQCPFVISTYIFREAFMMSCPVSPMLENKFLSLLPRNDNVARETAVLSRRVHRPRVPFGEMILGR